MNVELFLVVFLTVDFDYPRYTIMRGSECSCPYMIIFQPLPIIGENMVGWGAQSKKRPIDPFEPGPPKRPSNDPGPSKSQPSGVNAMAS